MILDGQGTVFAKSTQWGPSLSLAFPLPLLCRISLHFSPFLPVLPLPSLILSPPSLSPPFLPPPSLSLPLPSLSPPSFPHPFPSLPCCYHTSQKAGPKSEWCSQQKLWSANESQHWEPGQWSDWCALRISSQYVLYPCPPRGWESHHTQLPA